MAIVMVVMRSGRAEIVVGMVLMDQFARFEQCV